MPHTPGTFSWFECGTTDASSAKDFYTRLFGWTAEDVPMPGDQGGQYTLLQLEGEDVAGLYELSGPQFEGVPSHWLTYVTVADADASVGRAEELGATLIQPAIDVPGVGRMAFLADPTGAHFAVFQLGQHGGTGATTNLGWCELHTPDPERAKRFYVELFGWEARTDSDELYTEFHHEGRPIGGMLALSSGPAEHVPPHWLIYAMVEDCDETLAQAQQLGGNVVAPAMTMPGVGRFGAISDPTGAVIAVIRLDERE